MVFIFLKDLRQIYSLLNLNAFISTLDTDLRYVVIDVLGPSDDTVKTEVSCHSRFQHVKEPSLLKFKPQALIKV
jgi:hypothetical protein